MAVQTTRSGGLFIEISGDYSKLQEDLGKVRTLAKSAGQDISNSLSAALSPAQASNLTTNLTRSLAGAQNSACAFNADLSQVQGTAKSIGEQMNLSGKALQSFTQLQTQAFQTQTQKAFMDNLRQVQRQTGASNEQMNLLAKSIGGVGNEFTKASEGVNVFGVSLGAATLAFAALTAAKKGFELGKEAFNLAANYETLGVVVQQVGKVAGYSAVEVDKNVSAVRSMNIAGIEARQSVARLIQSQIDLSKSTQLARVAQDTAPFFRSLNSGQKRYILMAAGL